MFLLNPIKLTHDYVINEDENSVRKERAREEATKKNVYSDKIITKDCRLEDIFIVFVHFTSVYIPMTI